jgi:hypothetical protein
MTIKAQDVIDTTNFQNRIVCQTAISQLTLLVQSIDAFKPTINDPNLQQAFQGTLANAKQFLSNKPQWKEAVIELPES